MKSTYIQTYGIFVFCILCVQPSRCTSTSLHLTVYHRTTHQVAEHGLEPMKETNTKVSFFYFAGSLLLGGSEVGDSFDVQIQGRGTGVVVWCSYRVTPVTVVHSTKACFAL